MTPTKAEKASKSNPNYLDEEATTEKKQTDEPTPRSEQRNNLASKHAAQKSRSPFGETSQHLKQVDPQRINENTLEMNT